MLTYRYRAYYILIVNALKFVFSFIRERLHFYFRSLTLSPDLLPSQSLRLLVCAPLLSSFFLSLSTYLLTRSCRELCARENKKNEKKSVRQ